MKTRHRGEDDGHRGEDEAPAVAPVGDGPAGREERHHRHRRHDPRVEAETLVDIGHPVGSRDEEEEEKHRRVPELAGKRPGPVLEPATQLEGQEVRAVQGEDRQ